MADPVTSPDFMESFRSFLPVALVLTGLFVSAGLFALFYTLLRLSTPEVSPIQERLLAVKHDYYNNGYGVSGPQSLQEKLIALRERLLLRLRPVSISLYSGNTKYIDSVRELLSRAGKPDSDDFVFSFLSLRLLFSLAGGAIGFLIGLFLNQGLVILMVPTMGLTMIGGLVPQFMLKSQGANRMVNMVRSLPDVLDLMIVCVEAGLGLDTTIQRVSREAQHIAPDICKEFQRVTREMNAGLTRSEVFHNLGARNQIDELRSLTTLIIQADKLGTSISDALRIYSEDMRTKRKQKAEELASKASIKMTFPLVLFIFPPLLIVLLFPIVIKALQAFGGI